MGFALILFLFGVVLTLAAKRIDINGVVLRVPLAQTPDTAARQFTVPIQAQYRIGVECSRNLPFETLKNLLQQGNLIQVQLRRGSVPLSLNYFAEPQASESADSSAQLGNLNFGKNTVGQDIAYFSGSPGEKYEVSYSMMRPLGAIDKSSPTLIIYLDPRQAMLRGTVSTVILILSYIFWFSAAVALIAHFLSLRHR